MRRLIFSLMDENGEFAVHRFALLSSVSVCLHAALGTGTSETGVRLRGAGGQQSLTA